MSIQSLLYICAIVMVVGIVCSYIELETVGWRVWWLLLTLADTNVREGYLLVTEYHFQNLQTPLEYLVKFTTLSHLQACRNYARNE